MGVGMLMRVRARQLVRIRSTVSIRLHPPTTNEGVIGAARLQTLGSSMARVEDAKEARVLVRCDLWKWMYIDCFSA